MGQNLDRNVEVNIFRKIRFVPPHCRFLRGNKGALRIPVLSFPYLRRPGCTAKLLCFQYSNSFDPHCLSQLLLSFQCVTEFLKGTKGALSRFDDTCSLYSVSATVCAITSDCDRPVPAAVSSYYNCVNVTPELQPKCLLDSSLLPDLRRIAYSRSVGTSSFTHAHRRRETKYRRK